MFRILVTLNPVVPPPNPGQYSVKHVEPFVQLLRQVAALDLEVLEFAGWGLEVDLELLHAVTGVRFVD